MGEQRNLTEENVDELREHLERMRLDNPELEYKFYPQDDSPGIDRSPTNNELIQSLIDKVEKIERRLDLIFGDMVLVDGKFVKCDPAAMAGLEPKRG